MNVNFEMAIQYINLESYDKAVEALGKAIEEEKAGGNEQGAIEYTCVLGELLADLGEKEKAAVEFLKVTEYCNRTNSLPKQARIAKDFLDFFNGSTKPISAPINILGMTSKGFISQQQRRKKK